MRRVRTAAAEANATTNTTGIKWVVTRAIQTGFVVAIALTAVGCGLSSVSVDAGEEAVLIQKPLIFGHGGVVETSVKPGRVWVAPTTQAVFVDMKPQLVNVEFDDLMTRDGVPLDFHSAVRYKFTDSVRLVSQFGTAETFFANTLEQPYRTAVRDEVKTHGLNEMAINASAATAVDAAVTAKLTQIIQETQAPVVLLDVTLGRANPPDAIKNQRIETAEQEQRQQTEQQRKLAEDQRKAAEESRAAADAAYNAKMELSPAQYLQLETIKMQAQACAKGGCTFIVGATPSTVVSLK